MNRNSAAAKKKNPKNTESPVQVLKEDTCPTSSGKSTLGYLVGVDGSGEIHLKVDSNDGGGFFSNEWIAFADMRKQLTILNTMMKNGTHWDEKLA